MDQVDAKARLSMYCDATSEPVLSSGDLDMLLADNRIRDYRGLYPIDTGWIGTYQLDSAAADGWRIKAGRCAQKFDFTSDVHGYTRSQMYDHCISMVEQYAGRIVQTIVTGGDDAVYDPVIGNLNPGN